MDTLKSTFSRFSDSVINDIIKPSSVAEDVVLSFSLESQIMGVRVSFNSVRCWLVTENEISRGIFDSANAGSRSLCFIRTFDNVGSDLGNEKQETVGRFIDFSSENGINKEASVMLQRLRARLSNCDVGMRRYDVPWKGVALEQSSEYDDYLDGFCRDFVSGVKSLIDARDTRFMGLGKNQRSELCCEVLHHARLALLKSRVCYGRESTFDQIRRYLVSQTHDARRPLVVYGPSGSGKTAVMARAAVMVQNWMTFTTPVVVLRFLGTSPTSSDVVSTAKSIVTQTCLAFGREPPADLDQLSKLGDVRKEFVEVLRIVATDHPDSALVIMIDSVDQLSPRNGAHEHSWLPRHLPRRNVYFIISVVADRSDFLEKVKQRVDCDDSFVPLRPLSDDASEQFIDAHLQHHGRSLSSDQLTVVREVIARCSNPLFMKLVIDMAIKWTSYTTVSASDLPDNMSSAIMMLFESVEGTFGPVFISHALGYLTCARGGLTAVEMDDVLSCDDEVLNDVYRYHDPPLDGTVRMPSLMWARVSERLREYLTEKQVDGKTVTTWYHRQFWEAAERRYLTNTTTVLSYHRRLGELYDQENGIRRTIVLTHRRDKVVVDADRRVKPQPLTEHNLRKLECLPFHLIGSGDVEYLKRRCLVNFLWLRTLMRAVGLNVMINEYRTMAEQPQIIRDDSIRLVGDLLRICHDSLKCDADLFAYNVVERLEVDGVPDDLLRTFVNDARRFMEQTKQPSMYPTHSMKLPGLDSPLRFTVIVGREGVLSDDGRVVVCRFRENSSQMFRINAFNLQTLDLTASIPLTKSSPVAITRNGRHFAYVEETSLKVCETETGEPYREFSFCQHPQPDVIFQTVRCLTISNSQRYVAVGVKLVSNQAEVAQRGTYSFIAVIDTLACEETPKSVKLKGKKVVDGLWFVCDDTRLLATFRQRLLIISVPDMVVVNEVSSDYVYHGIDTLTVVPGTTQVLVGASSEHGCRVLRLDVDSFAQTLSPLLPVERSKDCAAVPFGLVCTPGAWKVLLGAAGVGRMARNGQLWTWSPDSDETEKICVGVNQWKFPSALAVLQDDWRYAVIGWNNGDISICDLTEKLEVLSFHGHGSQVNLLLVTQGGENIASLSDDHNLKLWGVRQLLDAIRKQRIDCKIEGTGVEGGQAELRLINEPDEQCVGVCVVGEYAASATHINEDGLRFWRLDSGLLHPTVTAEFDRQYKESLTRNGISFTKRCHAEVQFFSDHVLYSRKLRRSVSCCVVQGSADPFKIVAHEFLQDTFLTLAVADDRNDATDAFRLFLVCDGFVDVRDPCLRSLYTIEVPKITEDIPNMDSSAGKRKLLSYRLGITIDWQYLLIVSPTSNGTTKKYMDVVSLLSRTYCCRITLEPRTSWKVLHDGFYYLTRSTEHSTDYQLVRGNEMWSNRGDDIYRCLVKCDKPLISNDLQLGVQLIDTDNSIEVWQTGSLRRLCVFRGHSMMVTSASFSSDSRLLVSGSLDNTVRLWSLSAEQQLCVFHTYGAVEQVSFDKTNTFVVVHGTSAPLRKRAIVLRVTNVSKTKQIEDSS